MNRHLARARQFLAAAVLAAALGWGSSFAADGPAPSAPPRVAVLGAPAESKAELTAVAAALAPFTLVSDAEAADLVVVWRGPGPQGSADASAFARFLARPRPLVVLGAESTTWPGGAAEVTTLLGASPGGRFAPGAAPTVLSDYGHPLTSGPAEPPAPQPLRLWSGLTADTFVLQEATAGEATTPLVWIRKGGASRVVHLAAVTPAILHEAGVRRLIAQAVWWAAGRTVPGATPHLQRTVLPDAHPGSFALTFPEGVGVCLDPVRGGINYLWAGEFADPRPRWLTKQGAPARLDGPVWYREPAEPAWRTSPGGPAAAWRFRGHSTRAGMPDFHYEVAGRTVTEHPGATPAGRGLERRFTVGPGAAPLWLRLVPQPEVLIEVTGARREAEHAGFTGQAAGEFTVRLLRASREATR
ncbi:MAG: ThuA domain-containing protein [Verrucomicrobia bacterium]|nr:ThuA domain-containing protein [Verrucomicrobiota bacterium]